MVCSSCLCWSHRRSMTYSCSCWGVHCTHHYPYPVGFDCDHFHIGWYWRQKLQALVSVCNNQWSSDSSYCLFSPCLIVNCSSCRWLVFSEFLPNELFHCSRAVLSFCICTKHVRTHTWLDSIVGSFYQELSCCVILYFVVVWQWCACGVGILLFRLYCAASFLGEDDKWGVW